MNKITVFDTSIGTLNMGDEIIVDSINRELKMMFNEKSMFIKLPTHERISRYSHGILKNSSLSFVAGTNLLTSRHNIMRGNSWRINILDALNFNNVILMGVGWSDYQSNPNYFTRLIYQNALAKNYYHSVRDNYTKKKLESIGITNVYNTGCATMWRFTEVHCKQIPYKKAKNVVFTLTDYRKDPEKDRLMIEILQRNYEKVYFWIQGSEDYKYIKSLTSLESIIIIDPTLTDFDYILESNEDLDFIGTRLHAGIRAMQKKRRSIIIGVDNRALEKKKDFKINVLSRENISQLEEYLNGNIYTSIKLDIASINAWKEQFLQ
ncbi:polysaccharide pyruvyl transferase family protein [Bacillus sp. MUM 13]|uniref:polysaccharide pyruvyl transferase family protein n=1 Tax=Bacillus sp. MUM 13 TaxID=1678001 RepID=UPI0008F56EF9|nr:polysaccharide pyruvyl transferase family protein [Bacillus sp. MUM 13]OIK07992.1 hypothetical protein BIV59_20635 [Bacillus sp. MUM 13]